MRRQDREISDINKIQEILNQCEVCRIGILDGERPYVVPMSFGYRCEGGVLEFYFHGAAAGKKVSLLREGRSVCLEFDTGCEVIASEQACSYSTNYQSVIAYGKPTFLEGEDKVKGLDILMSQYSARTGFTYQEKMLQSIAVYKVVVDEFTAKGHM